MPAFPRVKTLRDASALRARLERLGCPLPCDDEPMPAERSPLGVPWPLGGGLPEAPNRFVVQPMEGWDGTADGLPSELTRRRWRGFGRSGAGLVWGGEAVAVRPDGRANPRQLLIGEHAVAALAALRDELVRASEEAGHPAPVVGLQLTHSGRWSRPTADGMRPRVAFRHPLLDSRTGVDDAAVLDDAEVEALARDFGRAAARAAEAGFAFVDVKHCHGYLLHEFLAARSRPGRFGGPSLEDRTRLLELVLAEVRAAAPAMAVGVRLSLFDLVPFAPGPDGVGVPLEAPRPYGAGFGVSAGDPVSADLAEPLALVRRLRDLGVALLNVSGGSPYYVPHVQRPAAFPPSDGYLPPEDPLVGVARLLHAAREAQAAAPDLPVVSSGWSYLQEYVPHVAQACVREGWFGGVGLGRMMLPYPEFPADVLAGRPVDAEHVCRTFSDCTTAPRQGLVSGCYPLDPYYRERPERRQVLAAKRARRAPGAAAEPA